MRVIEYYFFLQRTFKICNCENIDFGKRRMKSGAQESQGEWQLVQRRRRFPDSWNNNHPPSPAKAKPYKPYSSYLTYAKAVATLPTPTKPPQPLNLPPPANLTGTNNHPTKTPLHIPQAIYTCPHSPTTLRFPPSPAFPEWKGRCFRCCRTGHTASVCRNPLKCGRC